MTRFKEYLEKYALLSLEKQEKLASLIGEYTFDIDYDAGVIRFAGGSEFPFQVLGTESDNTFTWLWAWADEQAEIPALLLKSAHQLKSWGENNGVSEFSMPSHDLDMADGKAISLISSGICDAGCFFREDYDGGALFLLLFGTEIGRQPSFDAAGLIRQMTDLSSLDGINLRNTLTSYLRLKNISFAEQGTIIEFELESTERMSVEFGPSGGVKSINGKEVSAT